MNFYNDVDEKSCAWMRQLIIDGLIPDGDVVCKSITDIKPDELKGYTQHHWFSGVAGWSHALDLAGWPRARPIFTASLPCQSFSLAGNGGGFDDPRGQLWYPFLELVKVLRPQCLVGEQVSSAIGKGWIDRVQADLEAAGYAFGFVVLGAHSVGAPHRRQRIYWMAYTEDSNGWGEQSEGGERLGRGRSSGGGGLGDTRLLRCDEGISGDGRGQAGAGRQPRPVVDRSGQPDLMAYCEQQGLEGHAGHGNGGSEPRREQADENGSVAASGGAGGLAHTGHATGQTELTIPLRERGGRAGQSGFWDDYEIIGFRDGTRRRIERGTPALAPRFSKGVVRGGDQSAPINPEATAEARRMRLHGYGNSVVAPLAAEFISVVMELFNIKPE